VNQNFSVRELQRIAELLLEQWRNFGQMQEPKHDNHRIAKLEVLGCHKSLLISAATSKNLFITFTGFELYWVFWTFFIWTSSWEACWLI